MKQGEETVCNLKRKREELIDSSPTTRESPARKQLAEAFHNAEVDILKEEKKLDLELQSLNACVDEGS